MSHDHVLVPRNGWYECACGFGLFEFEMPLDGEPTVQWRDPIVPTMRGKSAAYRQMVANMEAAGHGPGRPFYGADGRERGRTWDESLLYSDATKFPWEPRA